MSNSPERREAFDAFVGKYQAAVYRYLRLLGAARDEAEDLLQETFLVVLGRESKQGEFEDRDEISTRVFLRRTARNLFLHRMRSERKRHAAWADLVDDHLAAWLFTVCRNWILDAHKENGRMKALMDQPPAPPPAPSDPADRVQQHDTYQHLLRAVAALPENQREAIDLWSEGLCYREIAQVLNHTEGHVRVLVHRGLKQVREDPAVRKMF